ncbi:MAG: lytic transglycosylase domain-containing protein [Pseudomonadota bacterium]
MTRLTPIQLALSIRHLFTLLALVITSVLAGTAHADVYGYVDQYGTLHFSNTKLTDQYQLYMKGNESFNSADVVVAPRKDNRQAITVAPTPLPPLRSGSSLARYVTQHPNLKKYEGLLNQAAIEFGLEPALLKAVMAAESGFNPMAVSPKGAVGLMQVMPATARRLGLTPDADRSIGQKLTDPRTNIRLGARYLRILTNMFPGKPELVIASYNAGEGAVQKYKNTIPPYPETRNYVRQVTQFYHLYVPGMPTLASTPDVSNEWGEGRRRVQMTIPGRPDTATGISGGAPDTSRQSLE